MHLVDRAEIDVVVGPVADVGDFLGVERAHDLRRRAHNERAGRNASALGDQRVRADDAALADNRAVEDRRAHANQAFVFHGAGVEDRAMADGNELADNDRQVVGEMYDAAVLDVGALADLDVIDVTAQDGSRPDAAAGGETDIADHDGLGRTSHDVVRAV